MLLCLNAFVIATPLAPVTVLCRIERRPPKLDLTRHPYLPRAQVATTSAKACIGRLGGSARRGGRMSAGPQVLLAHHPNALKLPTFLPEYDKQARLWPLPPWSLRLSSESRF